MLSTLLLLATFSFAAEETTPSSSFLSWNQMQQTLDASYAALLKGSTLDHLDGNQDGKGTNVSLRNYLSLDGKFSEFWKAGISFEGRQYFRPVDAKNPNRKDFEWRDPIVSIGRDKILEKDAYSFSAKIKYAIPMTEYNKSNVGKTHDSGNGEWNLSLSNGWKFRDGDIYAGFPVDLYYKMAEAPPVVREDYSVRAKPFVSYRIAAKYSAKVEYSTGNIRHTTNGKWSKLNDKALGQTLFAGITYVPINGLQISPGLTWGSSTYRLNSAEASLYASYLFL
jgi:hypothetical protein